MRVPYPALLRVRDRQALPLIQRRAEALGFVRSENWREILELLEAGQSVLALLSAKICPELSTIILQLDRRGSMVQVPDRESGRYHTVQVDQKHTKLVCFTSEKHISARLLEAFSIIEWI